MRKIQRAVYITCFLFLCCGVMIYSDTVVLKNGKKAEGKITDESDSGVTLLNYEGKSVNYPKSDVNKVTKQKTKLHTYDEKKEKLESTAEAHYKLGEWCKSNKLMFLATKEWEEAVVIDPEYEKARHALGYKKYGDKWMTEEEYMISQGKVRYKGKWFKKEDAEKQGYVEPVFFTFTAVYAGDANAAELDKLAARLKKADEFLYEVTEGQIYLKAITLMDRTAKGDIVFKNLDSMDIAPGTDGMAPQPYVPGGRFDFYMKIGGDFRMYTFVHELNHALTGAPDENGKATCLMCQDFGATKYCENCWERWKQKYPQFKHPRPKKDWDKLPDLKIVIEDN